MKEVNYYYIYVAIFEIVILLKYLFRFLNNKFIQIKMRFCFYIDRRKKFAQFLQNLMKKD